MRILHVLDHSLPIHSGYTFRTRAILKAQAAMGLDVRGVTGRRHRDDAAASDDNTAHQVDGLHFHRTPGRADGPAGVREWREIRALCRKVRAVAKEWGADVLHAHSPALCGIAAARAGRALGIPVVYEIRAFWEDAAVGNLTGREGSVKYRLTRELENHAVRSADAVFTICNGLRNDLIARGFDGGQIGVMPNGVDLSLFGTPPEADPALAAKLGLADGPVIGFIGSFYDYEGLDDLIAALPRLRARQANGKLLLVGGGPMEDALRAQVTASGLDECVVFTGRVPHETVEDYYALIDILAYPRKASRLTELVTPLKPLEAMAQGRLVAASAVGGHRELITDKVTGTLFAPDDPAAIAEALADRLLHREDWPRMRKAAREHVRDAHDWSRNVRRYQDVYQALLGHDQPGERSAAA